MSSELLLSLKSKSQWSNTGFHRTFVNWGIKFLKFIISVWNGCLFNDLWCHPFTTWITVFLPLCFSWWHSILCQNMITVFFKNDLTTQAVSLEHVCNKTVICLTSWCRHFDFKRNFVGNVNCTRRTWQIIAQLTTVFQIKGISCNILYLSSRISHGCKILYEVTGQILCLIWLKNTRCKFVDLY